MQADEGEYKTLEVLDQIIECSETVRVLTAVNIHQTSDLGGVETDVLVLVDYL